MRVEVCGACRTALHVVDGDLPPQRDAIIPGHEIVGRLEQRGEGAQRFQVGEREREYLR